MSTEATPPGSIPLAGPQPIIKADQIAWVIFDKPDLAKVQPFLEDFGLIPAETIDEGQLFRGSGPLPYLYIARPAKRAGFVGMGFLADAREDLERLSKATGRPIDAIDRPGGGECVRLEDPNGFLVEVAFGVEEVATLAGRSKPLPVNTPFDKTRVNEGQRPPLAPATAHRLGHCVIQSNRFRETAEWYIEHLGLIPSDVQCLDDGRPALAFMRTDRGKTPSDHHALALSMGVSAEYSHCAFEVIDLDAIGQGQQVLRAGGWDHAWGIGRHILGSQLFDYWRDPDGHELEHYADGDVYDDTSATGYSALGRDGIWQWGADMPRDFGPKPGPGLVRDVLRELLAGRLDLATLGLFGKAVAKRPRPWLR